MRKIITFFLILIILNTAIAGETFRQWCDRQPRTFTNSPPYVIKALTGVAHRSVGSYDPDVTSKPIAIVAFEIVGSTNYYYYYIAEGDAKTYDLVKEAFLLQRPIYICTRFEGVSGNTSEFIVGATFTYPKY
jgi:hypothetical protein